MLMRAPDTGTPAAPAHRPIRYRPDIDGLRALAILPVLFYHLRVPYFTGGYAGVDVFFVISGFLITSNIRSELEAGTFSVASFYERRARRILPALFAVLAAVAVAGWLLFLPDEFRTLGSRLVSVVLFSSNILLWRQADYFAGPIDMDPLVHTWSLAVEEQFYILFPLLLWFCERRLARRYSWPTLALTVLSFGLSVALIPIDRTGDYYLLPTRAWELLGGALLAYQRLPVIRHRLLAEGIAAGSAGLILASTLLLTDQSDFPGVNALWPCLGAAGLIHANMYQRTAAGALLATRPMVAIGLISYSLYLVHWPLIVFARYQAMRDFTGWEKLALALVSFALAAMLRRFIERPFLRRGTLTPRRLWTGSGVAAAALLVVGVGVFLTSGVPARFAGVRLPVIVDPTEASTGPTCLLKGASWRQWSGADCYLTRGAGPSTLLWGDSHANQYRDVIRHGRPAPNILLYATSGCLPLLDTDIAGEPECRANNDQVLGIIKRYGVTRVVLSGNWAYILRQNRLDVDRVAVTVARLRAAGVQVALVGDNPTFAFSNPGYLGYRLGKRPYPDAPFYTAANNDWSVNARLRALVGAADFFDPTRELCHGHECLVYDHGQLVMRDSGHLAPFGRGLVYPGLARFLATWPERGG